MPFPNTRNKLICSAACITDRRSTFFPESDDFDREEVATYEAVARLFPRAGFFRPVVLVGPPGVGRNEIKRRIIAMDPDRFRMTIPRKSAQSCSYRHPVLLSDLPFFPPFRHDSRPPRGRDPRAGLLLRLPRADARRRRRRQVPGARRVQGQPLRDLGRRSQGAAGGRTAARAHAALPGARFCHFKEMWEGMGRPWNMATLLLTCSSNN